MRSAPLRKKKKKKLLLDPKTFESINKWIDKVASTGGTFGTEQLNQFTEIAQKKRKKNLRKRATKIKQMKPKAYIKDLLELKTMKKPAVKESLKFAGMLDDAEVTGKLPLEKWVYGNAKPRKKVGA